MASAQLTQNQDAPLRVWSRRAFLQRLLLPQDFMETASHSGEETLTCLVATNDYLNMSDRAEKKTVKTSQAKRYSTNTGYRPKEFKNESLKILADAQRVQCAKCRGNGKFPCATKQKCSGCGGKGRRKQSFSGTSTHSTPDRVVSSGAGRFESTTTIRGSSSTSSYEYKVEVICTDCTGRGQVTCKICSGSGWTTCGQCGGSGAMVSGTLIHRKFLHSRELEYHVSGLEKNEFKNGLDGKHFSSVEGDLVSSEYKNPGHHEIVLRRENIHFYNVISREYSYKDKQFHLNQISSSSDMKYVASGLPFSKMRVAVASLMSSGVVAGVVAVLAFLA